MASSSPPQASASTSSPLTGPLVHLNVGGTRFTTSRQTLLSCGSTSCLSPSSSSETFFTSLLSGRIASLIDETGAIFIDRDPDLFKVILNYLRTRTLSLDGVSDVKALLHEAEFYGLSGLVKQLTLCTELEVSGCGDVLFYSYLAPPLIPGPEEGNKKQQQAKNGSSSSVASAAAASASIPSRNQSVRLSTHSRNSSADLSRFLPKGSGLLADIGPEASYVDPLRVQIVRAHQNCIAVAYPHFVACFKQRENLGFQPAFNSPWLEQGVDRVAINSKMGSVLPQTSTGEPVNTMLALAYSQSVRLMGFTDSGVRTDVGTFNIHAQIDSLFFIGAQLVALSSTGKIGVWNSMSQSWQSQRLAPITSHDTAGSFLLLGSSNGSISYIDMQKFPLRMKDNDLLVTELYRDPSGDSVTAISVYLTPKTSNSGNWIEIAYGTTAGYVRVIVQHPETVGQSPQLFQTYNVHRAPVTRVKLSEKFLVSVCSEYNHVRTWEVTRFRGMISTQPGSTSRASFKVLSLESTEASLRTDEEQGNSCGPYGEQDDELVFVQKVVPETESLFIRRASDGRRVCVIRSVDGTTITSFCVHECDGSSRIGSRPRRFLLTGHSSGAVQMWDLTTALEFSAKGEPTNNTEGGPTAQEMAGLLDHLDLSNSRMSTPCCLSPSPSLMSTAQQQLWTQSNSVRSRQGQQSNQHLAANPNGENRG